MNHSIQDRLFEKKQRMLSKQDLVGLTPQQRQFAQQQFRLIYAQQMSRVTAQISHKKKIQDNLHTLDEQQSKTLKQQYDKLKFKMASIQQNRNKKLQLKMKSYKQNDERWFQKLKQIQTKFKQQNRQAMEKAKKYREQSEKYWENKQKKMQDISKTNFENSRTVKNDNQSLHRSFVVQKSLHNQKFNQLLKNENKYTLNNQNQKSSRQRQRQMNYSKPQIDSQIKLHRQKSDNIQKQRQTLIFQKALQKMQKIEQKRAKAIKQKQAKVSQPTKAKIISNNRISMDKKTNQKHAYKQTQNLNRSKSKDSLQRIIKDHIETKQRIQQQQFIQRGQILQKNMEKTRKDKILRMIKGRIHDMKVNTLMKQGSKSKLYS